MRSKALCYISNRSEPFVSEMISYQFCLKRTQSFLSQVSLYGLQPAAALWLHKLEDEYSKWLLVLQSYLSVALTCLSRVSVSIRFKNSHSINNNKKKSNLNMLNRFLLCSTLPINKSCTVSKQESQYVNYALLALILQQMIMPMMCIMTMAVCLMCINGFALLPSGNDNIAQYHLVKTTWVTQICNLLFFSGM